MLNRGPQRVMIGLTIELGIFHFCNLAYRLFNLRARNCGVAPGLKVGSTRRISGNQNGLSNDFFGNFLLSELPNRSPPSHGADHLIELCSRARAIKGVASVEPNSFYLSHQHHRLAVSVRFGLLCNFTWPIQSLAPIAPIHIFEFAIGCFRARVMCCLSGPPVRQPLVRGGGRGAHRNDAQIDVSRYQHGETSGLM